MTDLMRRNIITGLGATGLTYVLSPLLPKAEAKPTETKDTLDLYLSKTSQNTQENLSATYLPVKPALKQLTLPDTVRKQIEDEHLFGPNTKKALQQLLAPNKGYIAFHDVNETKLNAAILDNGNTVIIWTQPGGEAEQKFDGQGFILLLEKESKFLRADKFKVTSTTQPPRSASYRNQKMAEKRQLDAVGIVENLIQKLNDSTKGPLLPKQLEAVESLLKRLNDKEQSKALQQFDVIYYPSTASQQYNYSQIVVETTVEPSTKKRVLTLTYLEPPSEGSKIFKGSQVIYKEGTQTREINRNYTIESPQ